MPGIMGLGHQMGNHATPPEPSGPSDLSCLVWPLVFMLLGFLFLSTQMPPGTSAPTEVSYSEIKALIRTGKVREATLETTAIVAVLHSPTAEGADRVRAITPQQADRPWRDDGDCSNKLPAT